MIEGAYRSEPAVHFFNTVTHQNVVFSPTGNLVTGYVLGTEQAANLIKTGHLW
jgi:hypothetical protein